VLRLASNGADIAIVDVNDKKMEALSDHAEDGCVQRSFAFTHSVRRMASVGLLSLGSYMKGEFDTIVQTFLVEDPADVPLYRSEAKIQFRCYLFIAQTARDRFGYSPFCIR